MTLLLSLSTSHAQPQWRYIGLQNESIKAIAVSPIDSNVIYAGSKNSVRPGGLFRTTNRGATWDTLLRGAYTTDIKINPSQPEVLYYGSTIGLLKSYDGGELWVRSDSGIGIDWETYVACIAIDPLRPETLYCGTTGFYGGSLYKSTSGGESWYPLHCDTIGPPYPPCFLLRAGVSAIAVDHQHPDTLFAGVVGSSALVKTIDGGAHWDTTGRLEWGLPYVIVVDPFDQQRIYVGRSDTGFHLSTDGGVTWQKITGGLPDTTHLVSIAVNQKRRNDVYAMAGGFSSRSDVFHSTDGGFTWTYTNIPVNTSSGEVVLSPSGATVFAGVQYGVYKLDVEVELMQLIPPALLHGLFGSIPTIRILSTAQRD